MHVWSVCTEQASYNVIIRIQKQASKVIVISIRAIELLILSRPASRRAIITLGAEHVPSHGIPNIKAELTKAMESANTSFATGPCLKKHNFQTSISYTIYTMKLHSIHKSVFHRVMQRIRLIGHSKGYLPCIPTWISSYNFSIDECKEASEKAPK